MSEIYELSANHEPEPIIFCSLCDSAINTCRDFYKTCYKDIKIFKVMDSEDNHLCHEYISKDEFDDKWRSGTFGFFVDAINKPFCGECLTEFRPYIHYVSNEMIILFPNHVKLYDSSDEENSEEEEEEN